jgi:hypothetical protein
MGDQWMMNWKGYVRQRYRPNWRYYPGVFQKRLRKITNNLCQYSRYAGRVFGSWRTVVNLGFLDRGRYFSFK